MSDYWYPTNLFSANRMITDKKPCVNDPRFTYTGKEASPLRFGYAPHGYDVGTRMKGRDEMWMVAKKNDVNVWIRIPSDLMKNDLTKDTPVIPAIESDPVPEPDEPAVKPAPKKKATPRKKPVPVPVPKEDEPVEEPDVAEAPKKKAVPKKKAAVAVKEDNDEEAKAPKKKAAPKNKDDDKPKKVTDYQLYIKLAHANAKTDAEVQAMPSNERFKFVSSRAAADWKKMTADEKVAAVESMK